MKAIEKLRLIKDGKLSAEKNVKNFLEKIKKDKNNIFLEVDGDNALLFAKEVDGKLGRGKAGKLSGLVFAVKSNINVFGLHASCASKTLENYKSGYDATVIRKIREADGIIIGMTNMDEFACGSSGETSAFGPCENPAAPGYVPGGSSSGSAAAVAAELCDVALGSDTACSVRLPASHCGVVGIKPTYGIVSRYGLVDLGMSFDQIGPLTSCVKDMELVYSVIKGKDERDATSIDIKNKAGDIKKLVIGIPKVNVDKRIGELINKRIKEVALKEGYTLKDIEIKHIDLGVQTYYPIVYVEFFSGTRKFDGRRYGKKIEDSCGEEVLRRILGGQMISREEFSNRYYKKALDAKSVIKKEIESALEKVDCLIMPTVPKLPHKIGEKISIEDMYNYDVLTVLANLAEVPAISVPAGKIDGLPVGLQIFCSHGEDLRMLRIAEKFEL